MRLTSKEALWVKLLLLALIGEGVVIGVHALFFPHYFYQHFLLGANWLPKLGPYNQEMTRTAGALYLGLSVPGMLALLRPTPRLLQAYGAINAIAAFPHMVYHLTMANMSGYTETIPQAGALFATVIGGAALIEISRNGQHRFFLNRPADGTSGYMTAPAETRVSGSRASRLRLLLGVLLIENLIIGFLTLFFPNYFYKNFPVGAGWIAKLGAYSQHLTIDTGALSFGFAIAIVLAIAWLDTGVVRSLGWGTAAASLAEMIYHLAEAKKQGTLATVAQAGVLFLTAVIGLAIVAMSRTAQQSSPKEIRLTAATAPKVPVNPA
jgi:hypothetical protein